MKRHAPAALLLTAVFFVVAHQARVWNPVLWLGDLGNLPCQALRMAWGEVVYRDFAAKNPVGVFVLPFLAFRAFGPTMDTLAFLTALQFTALIAATYWVARRSAPGWAWVVVPLSLFACLGSCGLIHHPWAGAVGLVAIRVLYESLFCGETRWVRAGLILGLAGLFHQLVFLALSVALVVYRAPLRVAAVAAATILGGYAILALSAGDAPLIFTALRANAEVAFYHHSMAANNPLFFTDFLDFPPMLSGPAGVAHRVLEVLDRILVYLGFPLLAAWTFLRERRNGWISWLLFSGALLCLAAYPQFTFAHMRAFAAPVTFVLLAHRIQKGAWPLALVAALVSLLGVEEAVVTLATERQSVRFPAGVVYVESLREAQGLQAICDRMCDERIGQPLIVYPYFSLAYFLFLRQNAFKIQEMYPPKLLPSAGFSVDGPVYREGLSALAQRPPRYALRAVGTEQLFARLEALETRPDPGNPLLDFLATRYEPVVEMQKDDGTPWIVLSSSSERPSLPELRN